MKILVAFDGSTQALSALETFVGKFGVLRDAPRLTLIHVHLPVPHNAAAVWVGKEVIDRYYEEESDAALAPAIGLLSARGIPFAVEKRVGNPAEEIVRHATAGEFDLIAIGTHGHTALANLVMGSVATRVVATSTVRCYF